MIRSLELDKDILYNNTRGMKAYEREVNKFDSLQPSCRMMDLISPREIRNLLAICKDSSLQCHIMQKFELMKRILEPLGFVRYINGTNRVCFKHNNHPDILLKVAIDEVGLKDSLSEYHVQNIFKPYVCKIYEVDPTGVVALVETVQPIKRHEQLAMVADEMYDVLNRFFGASKYLMEDIGEKYFLNWGIREGFGLVLLDYPYLYSLDKHRSFCRRKDRYTGELCRGEVDYDAGFNHLYCKRCGMEYKVKEIGIKLDTAIEERRSSIPMYRNDGFDEFEPSIIYITDGNGHITHAGNLADFNIDPRDIESGKLDKHGNVIEDIKVEEENPSKDPKPMSKRHMAMVILEDLKEHGVEIPEEYLNKIRALYNIPLEKEDDKTVEAEKPKRSLFHVVKEGEKKEPLNLNTEEEPKEIDAEIEEVKDIKPKNSNPTPEEKAKAASAVADMFSKYDDEDDNEYIRYEDEDFCSPARFGDGISDADIDKTSLDQDTKDFIKEVLRDDRAKREELSLAASLGLPKEQKVQGIPEKYLDVSEEERAVYQQMSGDDFIDMMYKLFDETKASFITSFGPGHLMENNGTLHEDFVTVMDEMLGKYMVANDVDVSEVKAKAIKIVDEYYRTHRILNQFKALDKEVLDAERQDKSRASDKKSKKKFRK